MAGRVRADDRRAGGRLPREPGMAASAVPAPLREIGFDQNLDRAAAARRGVQRRARPDGARSASTSDRSRSCSRSSYYDCPMLCTLVLNALASTLGVLSLDAGKDFEVVIVSFDPREKPARRAAKKAELPCTLQSSGRRGRLAFPDRRPAVDRAPDESRRLPLRLGRRDEAVRASDRHHRRSRPTAGRRGICSASSTARAISAWRSSKRPRARSARPVDSLLLYCYHYDPMTGRYGLSSCACCGWPASPPCSPSVRSSSSWCGAEAPLQRQLRPELVRRSLES